MNTSRRWTNLMRFSLNGAVSLQTIRIRSERTPFSNGGHSTTRNRSKLAQKGSAKPFMRKAYKDCGARFDDLSGTVLAGHHQPLQAWILCLYFMGLNLSNHQIARQLRLNDDDVLAMASHLREGSVAKVPEATLERTVEADEVYVVAGHKGNPAAVQKKVGPGGADSSRERAAVARLKRKSRRSWA